ncbi:hypothetical protein [Goekera deserti]|uniref:hypothetical protein n=1 Tax=Goekera deserti TaxID=2497753 RepID=UPI00139154CA|nr:hypothetical protein [Goekera deserti]NDI50410.1 hypothetical protein [Goekera deserti]
MTHPSEMVVIRPPLVFRVLFVGVLVFAVATFLGPLLLDTLRDGDTGLLVFLVPFSLLWCGFFVRAVLLSVSTTADGRLRVVNRLRTTTYERADIEDVRLPPRGMQGGGAGGDAPAGAPGRLVGPPRRDGVPALARGRAGGPAPPPAGLAAALTVPTSRGR